MFFNCVFVHLIVYFVFSNLCFCNDIFRIFILIVFLFLHFKMYFCILEFFFAKKLTYSFLYFLNFLKIIKKLTTCSLLELYVVQTVPSTNQSPVSPKSAESVEQRSCAQPHGQRIRSTVHNVRQCG